MLFGALPMLLMLFVRLLLLDSLWFLFLFLMALLSLPFLTLLLLLFFLRETFILFEAFPLMRMMRWFVGRLWLRFRVGVFFNLAIWFGLLLCSIITLFITSFNTTINKRFLRLFFLICVNSCHRWYLFLDQFLLDFRFLFDWFDFISEKIIKKIILLSFFCQGTILFI